MTFMVAARRFVAYNRWNVLFLGSIRKQPERNQEAKCACQLIPLRFAQILIPYSIPESRIPQRKASSGVGINSHRFWRGQ